MGKSFYGFGSLDVIAPNIYDLDPLNGEIDVPLDAGVSFKILDEEGGSGVNLSAVQVGAYLSGVGGPKTNAVVNGAINLVAFSGVRTTLAPRGYQYDLQPISYLAALEWIRWEWEAEDNAPLANRNTGYWKFQTTTTAPKVQAWAIDENTIRIHFGQSMQDNEALSDPDNYSITPLVAGAVSIAVLEVRPQTFSPFPWYVDLICTEMTNAKSYRAAATTDGPISKLGEYIEIGFETDDFFGIGVAPTILRVEPSTEKELILVFDESMRDNQAVRDVRRYTFSGDLEAIEVVEVERERVTIKTTDQQPGVLYSLTVDNT